MPVLRDDPSRDDWRSSQLPFSGAQRPNHWELHVQFDWRKIRQTAWEVTTTQLRQQGIRPNIKIARRRAYVAIREYASANQINIAAVDHEGMAERIAASIVRNWKPEFVRPEPAVRRSARSLQDEQILSCIFQADGTRASIRAVAEMLNLPKARVQRVLAAANLEQRQSRSSLSLAAQSLLSVLDQCVPVDGIRAVDKGRLMQASEIDALHADAIFAEINAARVSTKLVSTATASCMGTTWVIVSRGRNRSNAKLLSWLERAELRRMAPRRNPLRPDQRHYVLEPATTISGLVERDVTAVLAVLYGARSIDVWRQFVKASLDGEHEGSAIDREAIVTVCQSMLRLDLDLEQALNKAMNWPSARATRSACQKLFQLTIELLSDADYKSEKWLVQKWSDVTSYRQKIESHRLPGRILQDFDDLMARVEDEWWPASPPGGEEDSHAGDLEQQAVWDEDLSGFLRNEDGAAGRPGRTMDADEGTDETDE